MLTRVYIYGIVEEPCERVFGYSGIDGAGVYTVNFGNLAAVVSCIETEDVDPTRRNVRAHIVVQDELMREYTLLPMGFGMVAEGEEAVKGILERNHDALLAELGRLSGKIEAGVKVLWNKEAIVNELREKDSEFDRLKSELSTASRERAEVLLVEIGKRVEGMAFKWRHKYGSRIYGSLRALAIDASLNKIVAPQCLLNASFLVNKAEEDRFKARIYDLDAQYAGKLEFKYVAPLPPYSFVTIRLEGGQKGEP